MPAASASSQAPNTTQTVVRRFLCGVKRRMARFVDVRTHPNDRETLDLDPGQSSLVSTTRYSVILHLP